MYTELFYAVIPTPFTILLSILVVAIFFNSCIRVGRLDSICRDSANTQNLIIQKIFQNLKTGKLVSLYESPCLNAHKHISNSAILNNNCFIAK